MTVLLLGHYLAIGVALGFIALAVAAWVLLVLGGGIHRDHPCGDPDCDEDHQ
jgi:hypothetical protein